MPIRKSDNECSPKATNMKGVGGLWAEPHGSIKSFADDKAPGDLIP